MKGTNTWTIIQYNVNKSKDKVQHHFLNTLDPSKHHIIAMQEPWQNLRENTTVRHPAYHLVFPDYKNSRTCIYVSKELAIDKWKVEATTEEAKGDITSISLQTSQGKVCVHNIYNPPPLAHSSRELGTLQWIPQILAQKGKHVLIGDFNLHHPSWGGQVVLQHHRVAEDLMGMLCDANMELILPEGLITWKSRGSQSTLDLAFVSKELEDNVMKCHQAEELESSSDHIPICTELNIEPPKKSKAPPRPQWKRADWDTINQMLDRRLRTII